MTRIFLLCLLIAGSTAMAQVTILWDRDFVQERDVTMAQVRLWDGEIYRLPVAENDVVVFAGPARDRFPVNTQRARDLLDAGIGLLEQDFGHYRHHQQRFWHISQLKQPREPHPGLFRQVWDRLTK